MASKYTIVLSAGEIDHICNILAIDADTIEAMRVKDSANKLDEALTQDHTLDLALIKKLASSKVTGKQA